MLKLNTVSMIATPGKTASHHLFATSVSRLSASMLPHVGTSGGTPSPRKESAASERMTLATLNEAITVNGARMFGRIVRKMIEKAVKGMLPHNRLGRQQLSKLKVYSGPQHPHTAQQPQPFTISQVAQ